MNDSTALFLLGMQYYATKETIGPVDNPVIVGWFKEIGHSWVKDDETAWCSCFVNWLAMKQGLERSGKLDARSWLKVGEHLHLSDVRLGDVVVFWREDPKSWKGHVGLYAGRDLYNVYVLGGNQDNMVNIKGYPREQLLGMRRLKRIEF